MKYFISPLPKESVKILQECYLIETNRMANMLYFFDNDYPVLQPLFEKGLINVELQIIKGNSVSCICLTAAGINFLKSMEIDERKALLLANLNKREIKN